MSIIMKFEYLPNEILMKCFQYLNATDVIYSFNQLNYRFSKLIRNSPLHLSCSQYQQSLFDIYKHMFIKSLTILNCKFDDLFELFQNLSMIKYFKIEHLYNNFMTVGQLNLLDITVEKFIINDSQIKKFEIIEFLLNQMTKLQFFSISSSQIHIIDAIRWQNLITHSLHHLHTFKFCFDSDIADKLKMNDKLIKYDLYNVSIIAVLPDKTSSVLLQFIASLFITHGETKLNSIGNLLTDGNIDPPFLPGSFRRNWCHALISPLLLSSTTTATNSEPITAAVATAPKSSDSLSRIKFE
ncbi:unnamed protein product [Adineta steineri]|uniref:F-box domain-containing protein n=1 Tax=Adineta steineri TaxID=433720 RepID=A0A815JCU4_9BILA|nr:unnamed protein product [Adineta steineri]